MRNPLLYRVGIEGRCFSTWLFVKWLIYSLVHAAFIFYSCFYVMVQPQAHQSTGLDIGFWSSGMTVYGVCIFVANMVIAFKHHTHTYIGVFFLFLCSFSYFVFFWLFSFAFGNEIGNLFFPTFSMRIVYMVSLFIVFSVYLGELAYSNCKRICKKPPPERNTETEQLLDNNDD
jgi:magnesium-transporting ATPase (P-type)